MRITHLKRQVMHGGMPGLRGGDSSSSSSSSQTTNTTNIDRRQVVGEGGFGFASDGAAVTINNQSMDAGIVERALDTVKAADATNGEGFTKLLSLADKLFTGAGAMVEKTQTASIAQLETINAAAADAKGQIDQKTMIVLAVAAAGALVLTKGKI